MSEDLKHKWHLNTSARSFFNVLHLIVEDLGERRVPLSDNEHVIVHPWLAEAVTGAPLRSMPVGRLIRLEIPATYYCTSLYDTNSAGSAFGAPKEQNRDEYTADELEEAIRPEATDQRRPVSRSNSLDGGIIFKISTVKGELLAVTITCGYPYLAAYFSDVVRAVDLEISGYGWSANTNRVRDNTDRPEPEGVAPATEVDRETPPEPHGPAISGTSSGAPATAQEGQPATPAQVAQGTEIEGNAQPPAMDFEMEKDREMDLRVETLRLEAPFRTSTNQPHKSTLWVGLTVEDMENAGGYVGKPELRTLIGKYRAKRQQYGEPDPGVPDDEGLLDAMWKALERFRKRRNKTLANTS